MLRKQFGTGPTRSRRGLRGTHTLVRSNPISSYVIHRDRTQPGKNRGISSVSRKHWHRMPLSLSLSLFFFDFRLSNTGPLDFSSLFKRFPPLHATFSPKLFRMVIERRGRGGLISRESGSKREFRDIRAWMDKREQSRCKFLPSMNLLLLLCIDCFLVLRHI